MAGFNPGRPIDSSRVLGPDWQDSDNFQNQTSVNEWLTANPERVLGGVHFSQSEGGGSLSCRALLLQASAAAPRLAT